MIDKDTKSALLFFAIEFGLVLGTYVLARSAVQGNNFGASMLALPLGMAAIGVYVVNIIFIVRLVKEGRSTKQLNRSALRLATGTAAYPLCMAFFFATQ